MIGQDILNQLGLQVRWKLVKKGLILKSLKDGVSDGAFHVKDQVVPHILVESLAHLVLVKLALFPFVVELSFHSHINFMQKNCRFITCSIDE